MKKRTRNMYRDTNIYFSIKPADGTKYPPFKKKERVLSELSRLNDKTWRLGVDVAVHYQRGVENSATFYDMTSLKCCLRDWLEPSQVQYSCGEGWN